MSNWNYSVFWDELMNQAKTELGEHEFALWFNIQYDSSTETSIVIRVPSSFYKDQIVRQYQKYLEDKLYDLMGKKNYAGFHRRQTKPDRISSKRSQERGAGH